MAEYSRIDMYYLDYSWTVYQKDNPKVIGEPDNTLLNRSEGYEMLYFINTFAELHKLTGKPNYVKIERMIKERVPANIHSQRGIKDWIEENW